jgi:hypothetical protein
VIFLLFIGCVTCHPTQFSEWQRSRHASAFTNAIFQESYARQRGKWCRECHQPSEAGVDCESCHVRDGKILSRAELSADDFCARCHQFNFPGPKPSAGPDFRWSPQQTEVMQDTFGEWRRANSSARCQDCHMPNGAHTFPGGHDLELLRRAVAIEVAPSEKGVTIHLSSRGAGHRVPTGDPFRRLYVEICEDSSCDQPIARPSFGRSFVADGNGWKQRSDQRLGDQRREIFTDRKTIWWRLHFAYAASSSAPSLSGDDWSVELQRGELHR